MNLINCAKCGRLFGSENSEIHCSKCRGNDEEDFKKVREYLYDNPGASVQEVAEDTGVDEQKIIKFLKQERLEIIETENALLNCERCGVSIQSGRYCSKCKEALKKELSSALKDLKKEEKKGTGFHISPLKKK